MLIPNGAQLLLDIGFRDPQPVPRDTPFADEMYFATTRDHRSAVVAIEKAPPVGSHAIQGALLRGSARLWAHPASRARTPIVVLVTRALGPKTQHLLDDFIEHARQPKIEWVATDGRRELARSGPKIQGAVHDSAKNSITAGAAAVKKLENPYSDSMLCCVKALLQRELPNKFGHAFKANPSNNLRETLAAEAGVSPARASQFLRTYEAHRFVERTRNSIVLRRRHALFDRFSERFVSSIRSAARATVRTTTFQDWKRHPDLLPIVNSPTNDSMSTNPRFAIAAHSAGEFYGVHEVVGAPLTIYVDGEFELFAELFDLELDPPLQAPILLVRPPFPEAVFRFALSRENRTGWPLVDLLQCWLDAKAHPARGGELAAAIENKHPDLFAEPE